LPDDGRAAIARRLREFDQHGEDLAALDRDIGTAVVDNPAVRRLLTIAGMNVTVAAGLGPAIGDIRPFPSPQKLVSYFGLNPRVRQSGLGLAQHSRISKIGRRTRGPFWSKRLRQPPGAGPLARLLPAHPRPARHQVAGWPSSPGTLLAKDTDYRLSLGAAGAGRPRAARPRAAGGQADEEGEQAWARPCLQRQGPTRPGDAIAEQAERAYQHFVAQWQPKPTMKRRATNAAAWSRGTPRQPVKGRSPRRTRARDTSRRPAHGAATAAFILIRQPGEAPSRLSISSVDLRCLCAGGAGGQEVRVSLMCSSTQPHSLG
jgi:transposase